MITRKNDKPEVFARSNSVCRLLRFSYVNFCYPENSPTIYLAVLYVKFIKLTFQLFHLCPSQLANL